MEGRILLIKGLYNGNNDWFQRMISVVSWGEFVHIRQCKVLFYDKNYYTHLSKVVVVARSKKC